MQVTEIELASRPVPDVRAAWWVQGWPYLAAVLMALVGRIPTLNNAIFFIDEPAYLAQAMRLDSPDAFVYAYLYRTETKSQIAVVPHLLALLISQPYAVLIVHLFGIAAVIAAAGLMVAIARRLFGSALPGLFALTFWLIYLDKNVYTVAPLLEYFQTPVLLLGFWFFIRADRRRGSEWTLFAVGLCIGIATLIKPPAILVAPVLAVMLLWYRSTPRAWRRDWRVLLKAALIMVAGVVVPLALLVLPYFLRPDTLPELKFNLFDLTTSYALTFGDSNVLKRLLILVGFLGAGYEVLVALPLVVYLAVRLRAFRAAWTAADRDQITLLLIGGAIFAGYATGQAQDHYLIPCLPFLLLFVGNRALLLWHTLPARHLPQLAYAAVLLLAALYAIGGGAKNYVTLLQDHGQSYAAQLTDTDVPGLVRYIQTHSGPHDTIWVYHDAPEIYWLANRKPATKEPSANWLVNGHLATLYDRTYNELVEDDPRLIIGLENVHYTWAQGAKAENMRQLPRIGDLLARAYTCDSRQFANITICTRNTTPIS